MKKHKFGHSDFIVIRLPARPVSSLVALLDGSTVTTPSSRVELLETLLADKSIQDAIFLAAPAFFNAWQEASQHGTLISQPKLLQTLWRYVFRAYGRSTPFSIFAGVGMGQIGKQTAVKFGSSPWQTQSRLDSRVLKSIINTVETDPAYQEQLNYSLNNSLYQVIDEYRFSEITGTPGEEIITLASYPVSYDLQTLVTYLKNGHEAPFSALSTLYGEEVKTQVEPFLRTLIEGKFLLSNLTLPVTGPEMIEYLRKQLHRLTPVPAVTRILDLVATNTNQPVQLLSKTVTTALAETAQEEEPLLTPVLQTDLFFLPEALSVSESLINKLGTQFHRLLPLLTFVRQSPLQSFKNRFINRYDKQEIDLMTALDTEIGVGFSVDTLPLHPELVALGFAEPMTSVSKSDTLDTLREIVYSRYILTGEREVELTETDLDTLTGLEPADNLPPSWYLHGELYAGQKANRFRETVSAPHDNGDESGVRFALNSMAGASAASLLGRFCHGHPPLRNAVQRLCAWEQAQYPDELLAEIVHLPLKPETAGNVVTRPVLRPYEIPYISPPAVDHDHTIPLSDIVVSVSESGQLLLRSKRTGQRIRPRHSSAHNPVLGDEVYQFLALVQLEEADSIGWSWRSLSQLPSLPRLIYKNVILCPAQWTIKKESLPAPKGVTIDQLIRFYNLPRYVYLVESDNKLLLDLTFLPAQEILLDEIQKQEKVLLKEWLGEQHELWLKNSTDHYVSELIIPMTSKAEMSPLKWPTQPAYDPTAALKPSQSIRRSFLPGSDWLYFKVYAHEAVSNKLLTEVIKPFWQLVQKRKWATTMFFIRYQDPDYHLRVRFRIDTSKINQLLRAWTKLIQEHQESGLVHSVQIATYFPEIERYTPELIDAYEQLFAADSALVLDWLTTEQQSTADSRYGFAIASVQAILDDFNWSLQARVNLFQRLQQAFLDEQTSNRVRIRSQLNALYRTHNTLYFTPEKTLTPLIDYRSKQTLGQCSRIGIYLKEHDSSTSDQLMASLVHMILNRIFSGQQRRHELVVYHFLARHYETELARKKLI